MDQTSYTYAYKIVNHEPEASDLQMFPFSLFLQVVI